MRGKRSKALGESFKAQRTASGSKHLFFQIVFLSSSKQHVRSFNLQFHIIIQCGIASALNISKVVFMLFLFTHCAIFY